MSGLHMTTAFRRTAERRNKRVWWPLSPTEMSAKRVPFRLIAPLYEKLTAYLAKKWTFATPGPIRQTRTQKLLAWLSARGTPVHLADLSVADLDAYLADKALTLRRSTRADLTCSLRDFLRYLYAHELITQDLAPTVLSPTLYAFERLPAALTPDEVQALLESARQDRTPIGVRNYAILLLLATYGLRAGEVVRLRLEDIDWRQECLHVRQSKTGRSTVLPLLVPVGNAILAYLRDGRPPTDAREVFLRAQAPVRPFRQGSSLYAIVARRLPKAGIHPAGKRGPHTFRHA